MLKKKVCLVGSFGVGKTSLIARFVEGIFSDKYLSTIGVKIDRKSVEIGDRQVNLLLWDIAGEEDFLQIPMDYVKGTAGYLLICDGTRPETFETAVTVKERVDREIGELPLIGLINKNDLSNEWKVTDEEISRFSDHGWPVMRTSAKTGENVEQAFRDLARRVL